MLIEDKELPELYYMKHRHDDNKDFIDYENSILDKMLSPYMYENDMMNSFLKRLQPLVAGLFSKYMGNYLKSAGSGQPML